MKVQHFADLFYATFCGFIEMMLFSYYVYTGFDVKNIIWILPIMFVTAVGATVFFNEAYSK